MNRILRFIKLMLSSHSGISSKRVCGTIGFLVIIFQMIYCTIAQIQAPDITEVFIYADCALLGIDSITGIFYKKNNDK